MTSPSFASILKDVAALLVLIAATVLVAFLTLFAAAAQVGMTAGLGAGAAVGFVPEGTIPDPCETKYNCKPVEAILMEQNAK